MTIREINILDQVFKFNDDIWGLYLEKKFSLTISHKEKVKLYHDNSVDFSKTKKKVFQKLYKDNFDIDQIETIYCFEHFMVTFSTSDGRYFEIIWNREKVTLEELNYKDIEKLFDTPLRKRIFADSRFDYVFNRSEYKKLKYKFTDKCDNDDIIYGVILDRDIIIPRSKELLKYLKNDGIEIRKELMNSCQELNGTQYEFVFDCSMSELERVIQFIVYSDCYKNAYQGEHNNNEKHENKFNNLYFWKHKNDSKVFLYYKFVRTEKKIFWKIIIEDGDINKIIDKLSDEEVVELLQSNCKYREY